VGQFLPWARPVADFRTSGFSAFAGNPYLVSPELLVRDGLLRRSDVRRFLLAATSIRFVISQDRDARAGLGRNFRARAPGLRSAYEAFGAQQASWLDDFALFMALRTRMRKSWYDGRRTGLRNPGLAKASGSLAAVSGCIDSPVPVLPQWSDVKPPRQERTSD